MDFYMQCHLYLRVTWQLGNFINNRSGSTVFALEMRRNFQRFYLIMSQQNQKLNCSCWDFLMLENQCFNHNIGTLRVLFSL